MRKFILWIKREPKPRNRKKRKYIGSLPIGMDVDVKTPFPPTPAGKSPIP